jgi:hypothetical protein
VRHARKMPRAHHRQGPSVQQARAKPLA